jgi:hypothetical protein
MGNSRSGLFGTAAAEAVFEFNHPIDLSAGALGGAGEANRAGWPVRQITDRLQLMFRRRIGHLCRTAMVVACIEAFLMVSFHG